MKTSSNCCPTNISRRCKTACFFTWSASTHSGELIGLAFAYFSPLASLSATTTESRDAGDKLSSILRRDAWESNDAFMELFFKELVERGLSIDLTGNGACTQMIHPVTTTHVENEAMTVTDILLFCLNFKKHHYEACLFLLLNYTIHPKRLSKITLFDLVEY